MYIVNASTLCTLNFITSQGNGCVEFMVRKLKSNIGASLARHFLTEVK